MHLSVTTFVTHHISGYMTLFYPGSYFSHILLSFMFLIAELQTHVIGTVVAACPYIFYACFLINLDIAF